MSPVRNASSDVSSNQARSRAKPTAPSGIRLTALLASTLLFALASPAHVAAFGLGNNAPVVDSVSVSPSPVPANTAVTASCIAHDSDGTIQSMKFTFIPTNPAGAQTSVFAPITPAASLTGSIPWTTGGPGTYTVRCEVWDSGGPFGGQAWAQNGISVQVVAPVGDPPLIDSLTSSDLELLPGSSATLVVSATDPDGGVLSYAWTASAGTINGNGASASWTAPASYGPVQVSVVVTDPTGLSANGSINLQVVLAKAGAAIGTGEGIRPMRISVDSAGFILATDPRSNTILEFTPDGTVRRRIPAPGQLSAVASDANGNTYAGDLERGSVSILDPLGRETGVLGAGPGEFKSPVDLLLDCASDRIYVADGKAGTVKIYDCAGTPTGSITVAGAFPSGLALDASGKLYVSDSRSGKIFVYDAAGVQSTVFSSYGAGAGQLTRPGGLAIDSDGKVYAVDAFQSRLAVFQNQAFVAFLGSNGSGAGQLLLPLDAEVDPWKRLIVSNPDNERLEVFELSSAPSPACAQDADCDGMSDAWELAHGRDPASSADAAADFDGDGLSDIDEQYFGTNAEVADSDGDGTNDLDELLEGTLPLDPSDHGLWTDAGPTVASAPAKISLDGSGSRTNGAPAAMYAWTQVSGPENVVLNAADTVAPWFVGRVAGDYVFELRVSDGIDWSGPSTVTVTIADLPPDADAGPDLTVRKRGSVYLDARFSADPNGATLSYAWTQTAGAPVAIEDPAAAIQRIRLPETGVYSFEVSVNDGKLSDSDTVNVVVNTTRDHVPSAAASDVLGITGQTVALNASASVDSDGDPLTYSWRQLEGPTAVLTGADSVSPFFTPAVASIYTFELSVSDGVHTSPPAIIRASVHDAGAPIADAGPDRRSSVLDEIILGCSDGLICEWTQIGGVHVPILGSGAATRFVPIDAGTYLFELSVADAAGPGSRDRVAVVVDDPDVNAIPSATALLGHGRVAVGRRARLVAEDVRDDGPRRNLEYLWTQSGGPPAVLNRPYRRNTKVTVPLAGTYTFELYVDDGVDRSAAQTVEYTIGQARGNR